MSLIEISNSSSPIDICYSDHTVTQSLQVTGLSNGYLKSNSTVIESTPTIPITDITGFSGAIVTNPLAGNLDAGNHDIYHVNQLEALTIDLNGTDLNTRLTTDEANISANASNISTLQTTKVNKAGDTMTGNLITTNVYPSVSSLNDCGTITNKWANVYTDAVNLNGTDLTTTLADKFNKTGDTFTGPVIFGLTSSVDFNGQPLNNISNITGVSPTTTITINKRFAPNTDNTYELGASSNKWSNVYATDFNLNGTSVNTSLNSKLNTTAQTSLNMNNNNITNINTLTATNSGTFGGIRVNLSSGKIDSTGFLTVESASTTIRSTGGSTSIIGASGNSVSVSCTGSTLSLTSTNGVSISAGAGFVNGIRLDCGALPVVVAGAGGLQSNLINNATGVNLQFNGSNKLTTANTGVVVTGTTNTQGFVAGHRTISTNTTLNETDAFISVNTSASVTITLPLVSGLTYSAGRQWIIKDTSGLAAVNNIIINTTSPNLLDGSSSLIINAPYSSVSIYCNGSNYFIF